MIRLIVNIITIGIFIYGFIWFNENVFDVMSYFNKFLESNSSAGEIVDKITESVKKEQ